jgi:Flp pilus assembly protein TadG
MVLNVQIRSVKHQTGTIAIIVAISLAALVGFVGLALDVGHLFITRTELQDAADACALAAAKELTCDIAAGPCAASYLENGQNAGIAVAARNRVGFQGTPVTIAPADIRFSLMFTPNSLYLSLAGGANPASRYVMCIARRNGIAPWFMQVVGAGNTNVDAFAVATLAPSQTSCAMPIGLCKLPLGTAVNPFAGMIVGQWMTSKLSESATGSFDWIDYTPPGGGANELANIIKGTGQCDLPPSGTQVGEQGNIVSLGKAWNTRYGLYKGGDTIATAPPDYTGYAYTPTSWPEKFNAYAGISTTGYPNYLSSSAQRLPYQGDSQSGLNIGGSYTNSTQSQLAASGSDRRLTTVPVVDCANWIVSNPQTVPVLGYACVMLLHPMDKDNGPSATDEVWLEYRGASTDPNSPCATVGGVGGPGSSGPLVPALVQ